MSVVRVLKIPSGEKADSQGREVGDDWMLADFGEDHEGAHWYLTTDRVRASEYGELARIDPDQLAEILSDKINSFYTPALGSSKTCPLCRGSGKVMDES